MSGETAVPARARPLVEGALLAALATVLVWITAYVPLGAYLAFLIPTPVTVAVVRHGLRTGLLTALAAALLLLALLGPLSALGAGVTLAGIGLPLGAGIRARWPAGVTVVATAAGFLAVAGVTVGLALLMGGINPLTEILRAYEQSGQWSRQLAERLGMPRQAVEQQAQLWQAVVQTLRLVLPAALAVGSVAWSLLTYLGASAVLVRLGHAVPPLPPFARWQLPAWTAWAFLALQLLAVGARGRVPEVAERVLANLAFALAMAFLVHGLATAYFFLSRWGVRRGVAIAVLVMGALWLNPIVLWLGWLEPVLRLRAWAEARDATGGGGGGEQRT